MEKALRIVAILSFVLGGLLVVFTFTGGTDFHLGFGCLIVLGGFVLLALRGIILRMDKLASRPGPWDRGDS